MNFYSRQVQIFQQALYPKADLTEQIIRSKQFMDNNYFKKIQLADCAGEAFLSKFHFIRLFKSYYGCTPHQYLIMVRIRQAKRLLQTDISVSGVCFSVGFDSVPSFTTLFKKMAGCTPSAFQQQTDRKKQF